MRTCTLTYMHPHIREHIYLRTTYIHTTHLHIKERSSSLPFKDSQSSKMEKEKMSDHHQKPRQVPELVLNTGFSSSGPCVFPGQFIAVPPSAK